MLSFLKVGLAEWPSQGRAQEAYAGIFDSAFVPFPYYGPALYTCFVVLSTSSVTLSRESVKVWMVSASSKHQSASLLHFSHFFST